MSVNPKLKGTRLGSPFAEMTGVGQDEASVKAAADVVRREWGRADYLVNIAGINTHGSLEELTLEQWDRVMRVNVGGVFLMFKHFTSLMRAAGGAVVNRAPDPEGLRAYANTLHLTQQIDKPEEIAPAICFLLSDDAAFITGETLFVDGGFMIKR